MVPINKKLFLQFLGKNFIPVLCTEMEEKIRLIK